MPGEVFKLLKAGEDNSLLNPTLDIFRFGTSIPTADLPGIGASIRMPGAARLSWRSSVREIILLIFTPVPGDNS